MPGPLTPLPGKFAIQTWKGNRLTAVDGGGRRTDAIRTDSEFGSDIEPFQQFTLWRDPSRYHPDPADQGKWYHRYAIQTANGNYLTADGGGGSNNPNAIQTDRTQARAWEMFGIVNGLTPGSDNSLFDANAAFVVASGHYLTAVGGGGKTSDPLHTDAKEVRQWEWFKLARVGHDLGDALSYFIVPISGGRPLAAVNGGGETKNAISMLGVDPFQPLQRAVFRLERQPNNTYALRTANGNYVTANQGGGRQAGPDTLQTNRTQPREWEQFVFFHGGKEDGTFVIQTHEGSCIGQGPLTWATNAPPETAARFTLILAGV
ncbi:hypothetical protein [Bradyrhizobium neotropicale]|uniref:fascin domain-containing protein n=1 Tax=Bradyrhizobium neotropicale TaxID=1497615 RepID=UPI001AD7B288|nr:hypothetical protein [Bradyrhizobium neotropicale]MBO4221983.1 hypothetical protein [Bradyrhizobium neotropicale]